METEQKRTIIIYMLEFGRILTQKQKNVCYPGPKMPQGRRTYYFEWSD